jgi:integrase
LILHCVVCQWVVKRVFCSIDPQHQLEQIQLLLGHASIQTTERYLGTEQALAHAVNDAIGLEM